MMLVYSSYSPAELDEVEKVSAELCGERGGGILCIDGGGGGQGQRLHTHTDRAYSGSHDKRRKSLKV